MMTVKLRSAVVGLLLALLVRSAEAEVGRTGADVAGGQNQDVAPVVATMLMPTNPELKERIQALGRDLQDGDVATRRAAALATSKLGTAARPLLDVLRGALKSEDQETVYHCLVALGQIGPAASSAVSDVMPFLAGSDQHKVAACYALAGIGPASAPAIASVQKLVDHPIERINTTAVKALADIGAPARETILAILGGDNWTARLTMANCLRAYPGLDEELLAAVDRASPDIRLEKFLPGEGNALANASFEEDDTTPTHWEVFFRDGAKGDVAVDTTNARSGRCSLRITKTNGLGYIEIKSAESVTIAPGNDSVSLRMYFRSDEAPVSSAIMLRIGSASGSLHGDDVGINRGHGQVSQSLARNAPPNVWHKRVIMRRRSASAELCTAHVLVLGNPATFWIDDLEFPAAPWCGFATGPVMTPKLFMPEQAREIVAKRTPETAEIRQMHGRPVLLSNDQPIPAIMYNLLLTHYGDYALFEQQAGVTMQTLCFDLASNPGEYRPDAVSRPGVYAICDDSGRVDAGSVNRLLEEFACKAPNSKMILTFKIDWPKNYIEQNPSEAWLDKDGLRGAGTDIHFKKFVSELPPGQHWWPSMYSQKAMADAAEIVRQAVAAIAATPYANMIAGVFIVGGHDDQFKVCWADHSPAGLAAWRDFLRRRYGTDEALAKAWHLPGATIAAAEIPDVSGTTRPAPGKPVMFQDPVTYAPHADYQDMMDARTWEIQDYFVGIVKDAIGRPIIGITYKMGDGWSGGFETFLQSRHLDFCVPQPAYEYRLPGYIGGIISPYESLALKNKIMLKELDLRSWTRGIYNEVGTIRISAATSAEEFHSICLKEAGQMTVRGHGWWIYDIGSTAFRHPKALRTIAQMQQVGEKLVGQPDDFRPDVAVVFNEKSYSYRRHHLGHGSLPFYGLRWMFMDLDTSGVPYHAWYFRHLRENPELARQYKVLVFVAPYYMSAEDRAFVETLKGDNRTLVWHYAPGYISEEGVSQEWVSSLTGMNCQTDTTLARQGAWAVPTSDPLGQGLRPLLGMAEIWRAFFILQRSPLLQYDCQRFWIDDPAAVALAAYNDGKTALAVKRFANWTSVYAASLLGISGDLLNNIAVEAGAAVLTRPGPTIAMNGNFLSVHGMVNRVAEFRLPWKATLRDAFTNEVVVKQEDHFTLPLDAHVTRWFLIDRQ
jgi:hypothetical protein